ncbi:MAG TPA: hypothetical protein DC047_18655 [Blastocatellia bacterium]|nr:hypothetical protein [Blastocatellia bacterium]
MTNGSLTGNDKVWRKFAFTAVTTTKIRVTINNALLHNSRITEVEAWGTAAAPRTNVALGTSGASATASSVYDTNYPAAATINGDRKGVNWNSGGGWNDATASSYPDWLQVDFNGSKLIDEIDVFTLQDATTNPSEPTETMTFSIYGLTGYEVQYWDGAAWATVSGGNVSGNNKVWKKITFAPITTSKVRVLTNASPDNYSRVVELEAWTPASGGSSSANINWLVTDQLGTPRMIFDKTGSLATTKRHDYAPFGEELFNGLRPNVVGYGTADSTRQKFTSKEHDNETGLDYFAAVSR